MTKTTQGDVTVTDLFAGAGGLTEGFVSQAPERFHPLQAVEWKLDAAATFEQNFPGAEMFNGDIIEWAKSHMAKPVDVIVGGPPCQGFSLLGKRDEKDEKNLLWHQYAEVVNQTKPRYFVMENVPQFLTSPQRAVFEQELVDGGLQDYRASLHRVNTADYGAPQARKRMIILGSRRDVPRLDLPQARGEFLDHPRTVKDAIGDLPFRADGIDLPERSIVYGGKTRPGVFETRELHLGRNYQRISIERFAHIPPGGSRFDLPDELLMDCWRNHTTGAGDVMGRLMWDKPSVTIRTEFNKPEKGRYLHPVANRAITHLEAARIMGFPDDYRWVGTKTSIARQMGNAVPVALGQALAAKILETIDAA